MDEIDFAVLIDELQNAGETDRIEAKQVTNHLGKSLFETISAFSNEPRMGGGYLILGLAKNFSEFPPYYSATGIKDLEQKQSEIATLCRQNFNIPVRPIIKVFLHQEVRILGAYIPEAASHDKPVYIKSEGVEKGTFRRIGPTDQKCTKEDLDYLYRLRLREKHDETPVENGSLEDLDFDAVSAYRQMRTAVNPNAEELKYKDADLLRSLGLIIPRGNNFVPTIGGLILFGKKMSLRQFFPLATRVDYISIEGREWVPDPDERYHSIEIREALVTLIPRLLNNVMIDIPQAFALQSDEIHRKENPLIPRKVIREALCNAVMHRDYTVSQPIQIRRYTNRLEFTNPGYSLKPEEQLGLPGSITRNDKIATVLHEINLAETKGTGIRAMRESMKNANLTIPLNESDRESNQFTLTLLTHHLFDKNDIDWLSSFKNHALNDEEARALIVIREMGAITNSDYRLINAIDTLTASYHLRRLKKIGLIEQKGRGSKTYYIATKDLHSPKSTPQINTLSEGLTPQINTLSEGLTPQIDLSKEIMLNSEELYNKVQNLSQRTSPENLNSLIKQLCLIRSFKPAELADLLKRNPNYLRDEYLSRMVELGDLELLFPDNLAHPQQAYRTKKS